MDNSNSLESTMETADTVIFRAISEIRGKSKRPDEPRIYNFVKDFLDNSGVLDGSFWERVKRLEDQGVIINKPTKCGSSFFLSKPLHEPSDSNSNTINTTPTVSLPSNTPVFPNYDKDVSLLSEGIDSLEQFFDTQLHNLTQISPFKSNRKGPNTNNESDMLIKSFQETIFILKKELINKENTIKHLSIILGNITSNTYKVFPSNKESGNKPILEDKTDQIDSENEIVHELLDVEFEQLQPCYQHLLDQSPNQLERTISNDQCSNETAVTKGYKVTETNAKNVRELTELNKVTPPLKKARSCEEQLTKVRKKYHRKYIAFTNNKQLLLDHPFPKGTCLIAGDSILAGTDKNRLSTGKHKVKV